MQRVKKKISQHAHLVKVNKSLRDGAAAAAASEFSPIAGKGKDFEREVRGSKKESRKKANLLQSH